MDCKSDSSLESLILLDEKNMKKVRHHCHRKGNHKNNHSSEKTFKPQEICTENNISQEIHVQKQNIKCIINLKTTICHLEHKLEDENSKGKDTKKAKSPDEEKPKPNGTDERKPMSFPNVDSKVRENIAIRCFRKSCKTNKTKEKRTKSYEGEHKTDSSKYLLSPTTKPELDNLTYDEISMDSLSFYEDMTTRKKRNKNKKHCRHCRHCLRHKKKEESKLDTLIKRTKEREHIRVAESRGILLQKCVTLPKSKEYTESNDKPLYELPQYEYGDIQKETYSTKNDDEYTMYSSEMDISFVSKSTLVLDQGNLPYSPTDLPETSQEYLSYYDYPFNTANLKSEPAMDIEAYSPIQSPDHSEHGKCGKTVKTEYGSPYLNNNNLVENVFKGFHVDHIKTEVKKELD